MPETVEKAVWTTAYVNTLPDSAFLYIEAGGKKDKGGKTLPRSLRHFPVRDTNGKIDAAHARNAIARIPQSEATGLSDTKEKALQNEARRLLATTKKKVTKAFDLEDLNANDGEEDLSTDSQPFTGFSGGLH